jgi:hypothetical protein
MHPHSTAPAELRVHSSTLPLELIDIVLSLFEGRALSPLTRPFLLFSLLSGPAHCTA